MCDPATTVSLVRHMLPLIVDLATLLKYLPEEVKKMRDELEKIQTFIYQSDKTSATEEDKEKVKLLVERVFRLEDIIDEYMICEQWEPAGDPECSDLPSEAASFIQIMSLRFQIAYKIKHFKWLQETSVKEEGLRLPSLTQPAAGPSSSGGNQDSTVHNLQLNALFLKEDEVVGFESPKETLIDWLVNGKEERTVISVVAMGGQGKTTLAKQVFNNQQVVGKFLYRAWVTVSQSYNVVGLLRDMLKEFRKLDTSTMLKEFGKDDTSTMLKEFGKDDTSTMDRASLIAEVRNYLQNKRYVVFFDDVWKSHFWDDIEHALIDDKVGSRVFITTRDMNVANSCKKCPFFHVHELKPLTEEKSLELFYKKAFPNLNGCCPQNFMEISSEIVQKCKGLPLAIVAIGGVLACSIDRDVFEWKRFSQNLSSELERNSGLEGIAKILGFSYDDLPPYLKPCYLYFGMYPEDYKVRTKTLTRQWIAEGFVKEERGKSLENVAQGYLMELIRRSLVQASLVNNVGRLRFCFVHDLLREMIHRKFEDLYFAHFVGEDDPSVSIGKSRRLSVAANFDSFFMRCTESSHIRSLQFFTEEEKLNELSMRIITANYKLLKVLDFQNAILCYHGFPENLDTLINLRYLSFRGTGITSLPESIGKLENLETLDLRGSRGRSIVVLPKEISKLRKLRYLRGDVLKFNSVSVGGMTSLQTLSRVSVEGDEAAVLIEELGKLSQLRVLRLRDVTEEQGSALCSALNKMQQLETLLIWANDEAMDLHYITSTLPMLRSLVLEMKLNKLPEWVSSLKNLVKLTLVDSMLTVDPFTSLEKLPNLLVLELWGEVYEGDSLHAHDGGFPKLKRLYIWNSPILEFLHIERGAMPYLEFLGLHKLPKLNEVPRGIQHLNKLKHLDLWDFTFEFDPENNIKQRQIIELVELVVVGPENGEIACFEFGRKLNRHQGALAVVRAMME